MRRIIGLVLLISLMVIKSVWGQQQITFKLIASPITKSVTLVGDFNNWSKTANPMSDPDGDGIWETTMILEPGEYQYRFLLDDIHWIKDPANPIWKGEHSNSIRLVKSPQQPELRDIRPDIGATIRSSYLAIEAQYINGIGEHGLDVNNTKVLLDGKQQNFSYLENLSKIECNINQVEDGEYQVEIQAQDLAGNQAQPVSSFFLINNSNTPPVVDAGYTIVADVNSMVQLNRGICFDPDKDPIRNYNWKLIFKPDGSEVRMDNRNTVFPNFIPDKAGRYIFILKVNDGQAESDIDSVDVYAFAKRNYPIEFSLSDSAFTAIYKTSIDSVAVAGEFNRWSETANPMNDYNKDGIWTVWIDLDPGEFEYKFIVNGEHWITDPNNLVKVADGWHGFNSVVTVSNLAPVVDVKATFGPDKFIFDASACSSKIGEKLTFLWHQDINNPQRFKIAPADKITIPAAKQSGTYYYYLVVTDQSGNSSQKTIVVNKERDKLNIRDFGHSPDWAKDAIVYEVNIRRFTKEGNLKGLITKIPYLKALGINCIWLMPIWDGPTAHGYGPSDFFSIEQDYGTLKDFKKLVERAHKAEIRIILDFIANHTSDQHPYFLSAYHNPISSFRNWYCWNQNEKGIKYYCYEFYNDWDNLPNLNYEIPNVRRYIIEVATFWARLGVDGFRCDVAWGVPHDFWKLFRRSLKNINPDFLIINEVLPRSPEYHKDEFDMSYDTDFYGNLLDVMNGRKPLSAIDYGLKKTQKNYPSQTLDFRYIENHDMERFITQFGLKKTKLAATLLLTIPGTPLIYYGQEIGLQEKTPKMNWDKQNDPLFQFYKKLLLLRRQHRCFSCGEMIKILTNTEDSVYAYLRKGGNESFLIVLNFGKQLDDCQLLFTECSNEQLQKRKLKLKNIMTSEIAAVNYIQDHQIAIKLDSESAYVFKVLD